MCVERGTPASSRYVCHTILTVLLHCCSSVVTLLSLLYFSLYWSCFMTIFVISTLAFFQVLREATNALLLDLERARITALQLQLSPREGEGQGKEGQGKVGREGKGQGESGEGVEQTAMVVDEQAAGDAKSACVAALEV
jgi:hypothetical protein